MTQLFKGDELEFKFYGSMDKVFSELRATLATWFENAYTDQNFGGVLYDNNVTPLTGVIPRDVFIKNFNQIFEMWRYVGSFESYLYVFKHIFGETSQINFERKAPAYLKIKIVADNTTYFNFLIRQLDEENEPPQNTKEYPLILQNGSGDILLQQQLGITDFREVQGVLNSLNPAGIFLEVEFTLVNGGV